jgi:hypothetical protein
MVVIVVVGSGCPEAAVGTIPTEVVVRVPPIQDVDTKVFYLHRTVQ